MHRPTLQGFGRELHEALDIFYEEKFGKAGGEAKSWAKRCKVEAALKEFFEEEEKKEAEMSEADKLSRRRALEYPSGYSLRNTAFLLRETRDCSGKLIVSYTPRPEPFEVWLRQYYPELADGEGFLSIDNSHDTSSDGEGVLRMENSHDTRTDAGEGVLKIEDSKDKGEAINRESD